MAAEFADAPLDSTTLGYAMRLVSLFVVLAAIMSMYVCCFMRTTVSQPDPQRSIRSARFVRCLAEYKGWLDGRSSFPGKGLNQGLVRPGRLAEFGALFWSPANDRHLATRGQPLADAGLGAAMDKTRGRVRATLGPLRGKMQHSSSPSPIPHASSSREFQNTSSGDLPSFHPSRRP